MMLSQNTIFAVVITETLARTICIEAATQDEAIEEAERLYRNEEIVLDSGDFVDVAFEVKEPEAKMTLEPRRLPSE